MKTKNFRKSTVFALILLGGTQFISCDVKPEYELGMTLNRTFKVNGKNVSKNVEVTEQISFDQKTGTRTYTNLKEPEKNYTEHFEDNYYWKEMNSEIIRSEKWEQDGNELKQMETGIVAGYSFIWTTVYDAETKKKKTALTEVSHDYYKEKNIEFFDSDGKNVILRKKSEIRPSFSDESKTEELERISTSYEYDEKGQCIRSKEEKVNDYISSFPAFEVEYEYNSKGHLVFAKSATGKEARFYDETNPTSLYAVEENDEQLELYVETNWYDKIWHKSEEYCDGSYDQNGNLIYAKYDDAERFFEYDESGKCVHWREVSDAGKVSECWTEYFADGEIKREERTDGDFLVREYNSVNGRHFLIFEKTAGSEIFYEYAYDKNGYVLQMTGFTASR